MLNRKKMFTEKAIERDLANIRATWGLDGTDVSQQEEEGKSELSENTDDVQANLEEAMA